MRVRTWSRISASVSEPSTTSASSTSSGSPLGSRPDGGDLLVEDGVDRVDVGPDPGPPGAGERVGQLRERRSPRGSPAAPGTGRRAPSAGRRGARRTAPARRSRARGRARPGRGRPRRRRRAARPRACRRRRRCARRSSGTQPLSRLRLNAPCTDERRRLCSAPSDTSIDPAPTTNSSTLNRWPHRNWSTGMPNSSRSMRRVARRRRGAPARRRARRSGRSRPAARRAPVPVRRRSAGGRPGWARSGGRGSGRAVAVAVTTRDCRARDSAAGSIDVLGSEPDPIGGEREAAADRARFGRDPAAASPGLVLCSPHEATRVDRGRRASRTLRGRGGRGPAVRRREPETRGGEVNRSSPACRRPRPPPAWRPRSPSTRSSPCRWRCSPRSGRRQPLGAASDELDDAVALLRRRRVARRPGRRHPAPTATPDGRARPPSGDVEVLRFDSGWEPVDGEPGGDRWRSFTANAEVPVAAAAPPGRAPTVARRRPRAGHGTAVATSACSASGGSTSELGVNVALPVLPLHGPRAAGVRPDQQFVSNVYLVNNVLGLTQAVWDLRRLLLWLRADQEAHRRRGPRPLARLLRLQPAVDRSRATSPASSPSCRRATWPASLRAAEPALAVAARGCTGRCTTTGRRRSTASSRRWPAVPRPPRAALHRRRPGRPGRLARRCRRAVAALGRAVDRLAARAATSPPAAVGRLRRPPRRDPDSLTGAQRRRSTKGA